MKKYFKIYETFSPVWMESRNFLINFERIPLNKFFILSEKIFVWK